MRIEINEPGSEAFYRETVSVACQYRFLLKKPTRKLKDLFRAMRGNLILCAILLALMAALTLLDGADAARIAALVLLAVDMVLCGAYLVGLNKMLKSAMDNKRKSVLTLDDEGVELDKEGAQRVRASWDNVAFVRVFREGLCFFTKDGSGFVIAVSRRYERELLSYLKERQSALTLIEE